MRYTRVTTSANNPAVTFGGPVFKARALSEYQQRVPADHHLPEPLIEKVLVCGGMLITEVSLTVSLLLLVCRTPK